jgi:hypothetical protein
MISVYLANGHQSGSVHVFCSLRPAASMVRCGRRRGVLTREQRRSKYHALQTRFDVRNWKNQLTGGLSYSWSHNIDNGSEILGGGNFSNTLPQNPFDTGKGIYGDASIDIRHAFTFYGAWDVPTHRDQKRGASLGGWQLSASGFVYSGRPWAHAGASSNPLPPARFRDLLPPHLATNARGQWVLAFVNGTQRFLPSPTTGR